MKIVFNGAFISRTISKTAIPMGAIKILSTALLLFLSISLSPLLNIIYPIVISLSILNIFFCKGFLILYYRRVL